METDYYCSKMSSSKRIQIILCFQIAFIVLDLIINVTSPQVKFDKLLLTFLFM